MHLKHGRFATFKHLGSYESLSDTFDMIFKDWYFQNKKQIADRPIFLEYLNMELVDSSPDKLETLIYIPLKS
ncbi:MAG: hypothetical protein S4CHLAM20_11180 [Chlamydiia bacterium]|nr:hypothetical protein [Chlamydiia bacterium]